MPKCAPLAAALIVAATFSPLAAAADEAGPILASAPHGAELRVHPRMPWRSVGAGAAVRLGAELRCQRGCSIRWPDGTRAELDAGSVAVTEEAVFMRFVPGAAAIRSDRFSLRHGGAWIDRPAEATRPITLGDERGPIGAAGSGRTRLVVDAQRSAFASLSGSGFRRSSHAWAPLPARHAVVARRGGAPIARQLVAAPTWASASETDAPIALARPGEDASPSAAWQKVSGASRYRVEIAKDAQFQKPLVTSTVDAHLFRARELGVGTYWMRVTSIDADGLESAASAARRLGVVRMDLPRGSTVTGTRIALPGGSAARLADPSGLEMALGGSGFLRASATPLTAAESPRPLRLRVQGDPLSETRFSIEPRGLRADVHIAPALPRWPSDPIDITVEIADPSGLSNVSALQPKLSVMVGVQPVAVRFSELPAPPRGAARAGRVRVFHARLEPRAATPNVVRVAVADGDGVEIGRGFVEVAR
jgi:hypothetical protein